MQHEDKLCAQCQRIKPHAQFKRLLTRAQTKARGYVGNHRVEIDSKMCKDCQPKAKPIERLTKKELRNRVAAGDLHQMLADGVIKERNETVNQRRAAKMSSRWAERQGEAWRTLVRNIGVEITVVRQQLKYAQNIKDKVRQGYANTYLGMLNRLRARLRIAALKPQGAPESVYWVDHLHQEERNAVQDAWEQLPAETRARMKVPLSIRHRVQDDSKPDLKLKGSDYVSPAERIKKVV
jgi:hypothetical protein